MKITQDQAKKILLGNYEFSQLGFSLMITRLKGTYASDQSPIALSKCVDEINAFLEKYQSIMEKDFDIISKL